MINLSGVISFVRLSITTTRVKMYGMHNGHGSSREREMLDMSPAEAWQVGQALCRIALDAGHQVSMVTIHCDYLTFEQCGNLEAEHHYGP